MRVALFCTFLLFCVDASAQLNEQTCFCSEPKDCEIGTVVCEYSLDHEGNKYSGKLIGKFKSGDDPSPEVGEGTGVEEGLKRLTFQFFAASCSAKSFGVGFSNSIYTYLKEGDFENWKHIVESQKAVFTEVDFKKNVQKKTIMIPEKNYTLQVACYGQPNQ